MSDRIVELTPLAVEKVIAARAEEGLGEDAGLRLAVVKGGCSGYEYSVKFADAPAEGDTVFDAGGISVFIDKESEKMLRGSVLDFSDGLHGGGLKFQNPNADHDCGCGASFAAAADD